MQASKKKAIFVCMKKTILISILTLFILGIYCPLAAQTPAELSEKAAAFGSALPQEKVFVHIDNTCYFLGDTVWFKAYVARSDNHAPTTLSRILYVELLTPDGYFVERQQLEMKGGSACGTFVIDDSLYAGYYELRAYTLWMLNFGAYEHPHSRWTEDLFYNKAFAKNFFRDYDKIYSRVFPVFDKPTEPGDYVKDMTVRPLRRYFKTETGKPELDVKFYPEGGNIVQGTDSYVAFEANTADGRHIDVELTIFDEGGDSVTQVRTFNRGRGLFVLPHAENGRYTARFEYAGYQYSVKLPEAQDAGISMHVTQAEGVLNVSLQSAGLSAIPLGLQVLTGGASAAYIDVTLDGDGKAGISIPTSGIPTGVSQITLFDAEGRIYADRLAFVNHHDYDNGLEISGIKAQYEPYEQVSLRLHSPNPQADISISVRDHATDEPTYDTGNILTEMLLASELKGFVESPGFYFSADDSLHRQALDLLLLVQGWRRYDWRKMAGVEKAVISFMPEEVQTISGCVNKINDFRLSYGNDVKEAYWLPGSGVMQYVENEVERDDEIAELMGSDSDSDDGSTSLSYSEPSDDIIQSDQGDPNISGSALSNLKKEVNVWPTFVQGAQTMTLTQTTEDGTFFMQTPLLYDEYILNLPAADTDKDEAYMKKKMTKDYTDEEAYPDYFVSLLRNNPLFPKAYSYYHDAPCYDTDESVADIASPSSFTDRQLAQVTVRSTRAGLRKLDLSKPAVVVDAYDAFNLVADYGMNTGTHNWVTFPQTVAMIYVGDMGMDRNFFLQVRYDGKPINLKTARTTTAPLSMENGVEMETPSVSTAGEGKMETYRHLRTLDKIYIYTDYAPREQGSEKYSQDNQPDVVLDLHLFPGDGYQYTFRDRHYILSGYATCEEFYSPDYSNKSLPDMPDYRRTLYWNPNVALDADGNADITLFNNGKLSTLSVSAQGLSPDGAPLTY